MHKICVFLGSDSGHSPHYLEAATLLGQEITKRNMVLIYGGAHVGLMGALADSVLESGGQVIGVIPKPLVSLEITHHNLTKLYVVDTMQERKKMMADLADAFLAFPGGLGTLEEIFEIWGAMKIGLYKKPFGLFNINGYFNSIVNFLYSSCEEGFIKKEHIDFATISEDISTLLSKLEMRNNTFNSIEH